MTTPTAVHTNKIDNPQHLGGLFGRPPVLLEQPLQTFPRPGSPNAGYEAASPASAS